MPIAEYGREGINSAEIIIKLSIQRLMWEQGIFYNIVYIKFINYKNVISNLIISKYVISSHSIRV